MAIAVEEVARIATLARLELDPDTLERFRGQLQSILDHVAMLDRLGVERIPPSAHPIDLAQPRRPDRIQPPLGEQAALAGAPDPAAGHFRVPRVIGE